MSLKVGGNLSGVSIKNEFKKTFFKFKKKSNYISMLYVCQKCDPIPVSLKLEMLSSCQSSQMLLWRTIRHLPTKIVLRQQSLNEFQSSHGKCNFHSQGFLYHWFHLEFEECVENHFSKLEKLVIHSQFYFPIWNIWIYLYVFEVLIFS